MALKLITGEENRNAFKALIAAEFAGVSIEVPPFEFGVTNKTPEFLALNPTGSLPLLVTPDGPLNESDAIARYVARLGDTGLYGSTLYEQGLVDQWIDFALEKIDTPSIQWGGPLYGFGSRNKPIEEKSKSTVTKALGVLNLYLATRTYLVGDHITLADIITACSFHFGFKGLFSPAFLEPFPHVTRYLLTLIHHPNFSKVMGEVKQCQQTPTEVVPNDKSPFYRPPVKKAAPVVAKAAAAPKPAASASADDDEEKPAPKPKNPLDSLPPSPMILDAWKRLYSNTKTNFREVAIKGFWDMYDPEGYSLFFCDYKHNEENAVKFVTMNKVGGFLQRMDLVRKYAFAKMLILGSDPGPYSIKGVWLFRGPEVPKYVLEECYDCELYEWTKVDISDPVQKERVSIYFEEADVIDGLELQEAKCFK